MKKYLLSLAVAAVSVMPAAAQDFFSTDDAPQRFTFGARIGVNTSNRTISDSMASIWNQNSWGTGFDFGVVADINFKNFFSLQPGLFYESRSGAFAYQSSAYKYWESPSEVTNLEDLYYVKTQVGKGREYLLTVPIMASFHFNILGNLRWSVDVGPYFQFKLRSTFDGKFQYPEAIPTGEIIYYDNVKTSACDIGLKFGTSFDIYHNYYIGVHYLAGFLHPWNPGKLGGHNKAWMFTIGYNFGTIENIKNIRTAY